MMRFAKRRQANLTTWAIVVLIAGVLFAAGSAGLTRASFWTGWLLMAAVVLLSLYSQRKRLSMLPIGRAAVWLQLHAYTGAFAIVVFVAHTGLSLPDAPLEWLLWLSFVGTAGSGLAGLYWSRTLPPRLANADEELIFERIPLFAERLRQRAEQLVVDAAAQTDSPLLGEHYRTHLAELFMAPQWRWRHLGPTHYVTRQHDRLIALERYLADDEKPFARELAGLCRQKSDLDMHFTVQGLLKAWLFVHVPLTAAMLLLAVLHLVAAHAFGGA